MRDLQMMLQPRLSARLAVWLCVAMLLIGSALIGYHVYQTTVLLTEVTAKRIHREEKQARMAQAMTRLPPDQTRYWQALSAEIAFPWRDFFQAVERTGNIDIELLEMSPDRVRRQLVLRGEARNNAVLIKYVKALATQPSLRDVLIERVQKIERGNLLTIEFEIKIFFI